MSVYARTEKGFAAALENATWMAKNHNRDYALLVHKNAPNAYTVSLPSLIKAEDVEAGTAANLIHPDGSETKMF